MYLCILAEMSYLNRIFCSQFQAMMATEDGKAKVASFSSRMESMRSTAAQQVDGWSSQQRQGE
jgi:hypothetical protein